MNIQFLGATRTVTGSRFLIRTKKAMGLVDCGMYQGEDVEDRNYDDFEFDINKLDFVILTHSHLDHCGLLPKLFREGYRGKIYSSIPTRGVVEHMLLDSAKVQEIKYRESKRKKKKVDTQRWNDEAIKIDYPIYSTPDVLGTLSNFKPLDFGEEQTVASGVNIKFLRVGHALGAASVEMSVEENGDKKKIIFSGDMGNEQALLDNRFDWPKTADFVVMESLYGGINHGDREEEERDIVKTINNTFKRGGNVLMPVFTYQRSQEMLTMLRGFVESGKIPKNVKIYLDSPLAMRVTEEYKKYYEYLNKKIIKKYGNGRQLFSSDNFIFTKKARDSKRIRKNRRSIILAGHGMCAGGRMIFHLHDNLSDKRSSVLFVGFQAEDTLGREIVEGAKEVFVDDRKMKVKAEIKKYSAFSAHAGNDTLLKWVKGIGKDRLRKVFLVHAEEKRSEQLCEILNSDGYNAIVPEWKEEFSLN